MTRVTSKFQITIPKRLLDAYGIRVGDEVEIVPSGEVIAIVPAHATKPALSTEERLRHFDAATQRQKIRECAAPRKGTTKDRGWKREDAYTRGRLR